MNLNQTPLDMPMLTSLFIVVLVDLLLDILSDHDQRQGIPRSFAPPIHAFYTGAVSLRHTLCHLDQRHHGRYLWPHRHVSVYACSFLLDQSHWRHRKMYQHPRHYVLDVCHVRHLCHFRFQFCYPPRLPHQGVDHEPEPKACSHPHPKHGMHVSSASHIPTTTTAN
jgi:hypothetical protein